VLATTLIVVRPIDPERDAYRPAGGIVVKEL
jgi:hypothetical protein